MGNCKHLFGNWHVQVALRDFDHIPVAQPEIGCAWRLISEAATTAESSATSAAAASWAETNCTARPGSSGTLLQIVDHLRAVPSDFDAGKVRGKQKNVRLMDHVIQPEDWPETTLHEL